MSMGHRHALTMRHHRDRRQRQVSLQEWGPKRAPVSALAAPDSARSKIHAFAVGTRFQSSIIGAQSRRASLKRVAVAIRRYLAFGPRGTLSAAFRAFCETS